jgi:DNA repair protein RadA/Sms
MGYYCTTSDCKTPTGGTPKFDRWYGRCPYCNKWHSLKEGLPPAVSAVTGKKIATGGAARSILEVDVELIKRYSTGQPEFDRVLGGGVVPGSAIMLGGLPGAGKSTLLAQTAACLEGRTLYVSGEEQEGQVALRHRRICASPMSRPQDFDFLATQDADAIESELERAPYKNLIIDSAQTIALSSVDASPGSITQVKECVSRFVNICKTRGITLWLICQVTKDGSFAGPQTIEHLVDTSLMFEVETGRELRIIVVDKNRFGTAHEVGLFEMGPTGLSSVTNPSERLLEERVPGATGSALAMGFEGTRAALLEVQALFGDHTLEGRVERHVVGIDKERLKTVLTVLRARCDIHGFSTRDLFVNLVGGLRSRDSGLDLPMAMALASAALDKPLPDKWCFFGEVGLSGEIRSVPKSEERKKIAEQLGFRAVGPEECKTLQDALDRWNDTDVEGV